MFPTANYTFTIKELQDDYHFDIFDFDYNFYLESHKLEFEKLFLDEYRYREIGFRTIEEFQRRLQQKLNLINPYYVRMWEFELASRDIDYLANKDLTEEFERKLSNDLLTNADNNIIGVVDSVYNTDNATTNKQSNLNNVNASISSNKLTNIMEELTNNSENNNQKSNTSNKLKSNSNTKILEKTYFRSKGNIGVTSAGELKQKAIESILNIDRLILKELSDLFLGVY